MTVQDFIDKLTPECRHSDPVLVPVVIYMIRLDEDWEFYSEEDSKVGSYQTTCIVVIR